jgi:uncharacterized protein YebE (UPF0316 family)
MFFESSWLPLFIFCARIVDVSLGTIRTICVVRGFRTTAVLMAFLEVVIWVYAVAGVFSHLDQIINVLAYAAGFATGNAVGMWIEQKLALGLQMVSVYSRPPGTAISEALHRMGLNAATLDGNGRNGPVTVTVALVPRKRVAEVISQARTNDPDAEVVITDARDATAGRNGHSIPRKLPFGVIPGARPHRTRVARL